MARLTTAIVHTRCENPVLGPGQFRGQTAFTPRGETVARVVSAIRIVARVRRWAVRAKIRVDRISAAGHRDPRH
jgi:hypothetical protein